MYNYRYHLVTIVSIFAALIIGLLLGVALTGSDLVRDASSNLAKSLTEQFDELHAKNQSLSTQLEREALFSSQLLAGWQKDRLKGRTIMIITRTPADKDALTDELGRLISQSGGIPVVMRINKEKGFGLDDDLFVVELKKIVPEKPNEEYIITLTRALAEEWSFIYQQNEGNQVIGTDGVDITADAVAASDQGVSGAAALAAAFDKNYQLTNKLIESGYLEVTVSYRPLLDGSYFAGLPEPIITASQMAAYQLAQNLGLPYGINGIISTAIHTRADSIQIQADIVAVQIAHEFELLGQAGKLPYLFVSKDNNDATTTARNYSFDENLSYFALLVQEGEGAQAMMAAAADNRLSCVLTSHPEYRQYSVIALLTGAVRGTYGQERIGTQHFPLVPSDAEGNAPFVRYQSS